MWLVTVAGGLVTVSFTCDLLLHMQHFPADGYNGSYYAEFYTAVVERLKTKWPTVQYGGPVSGAPASVS